MALVLKVRQLLINCCRDDAAGDLASLELSSTRSHLRRSASGEDVLFHTNAFFSESMREVQSPDDVVYNDRAPTPLHGRRLHHSSEVRDRRFRELLEQTKVFDAEGLRTMMADHGPTDSPDDHTVCVHGSYWHTTASLQFFPRSGRMRVAYDTACRATYKEVGF